MKRLFFALIVVVAGIAVISCEKEEICASGSSVAAPLVPGGAIISASSLQQENQKFSTFSYVINGVRHETPKNSFSN